MTQHHLPENLNLQKHGIICHYCFGTFTQVTVFILNVHTFAKFPLNSHIYVHQSYTVHHLVSNFYSKLHL
jgi:hypothetical protein